MQVTVNLKSLYTNSTSAYTLAVHEYMAVIIDSVVTEHKSNSKTILKEAAINSPYLTEVCTNQDQHSV